MEIAENPDLKCRLCLKVFGKNKTKCKINKPTRKHVQELAGIELEDNPQFPKYICTICHKNLKEFSSFKSNIIRNQKTLLESLNNQNEVETKGILIKTETADVEQIQTDIFLEDFIKSEPLEDFDKKLGNPTSLNVDPRLLEPQLAIEVKPSRESLKSSGTKNPPTKGKVCETCGKVFKSSVNRRRHHELVHQKLKRFFCDYCGSGYYNKTFLKVHIGKHLKRVQDPRNTDNSNPNNLSVCQDCGKVFLNSYNYRYHYEQVHQKLKKFFCDYCGYGCYVKGILKNHVIAVHINKKPVPVKKILEKEKNEYLRKVELPQFRTTSNICDTCGKVFNNSVACRRHLEQVHQRLKKFFCDYCGYGCYTKAVLKGHILAVHIKNRSHGCTECGKHFSTKVLLRSHMVSHSNQRNYSCNRADCDKTFKSKSTLYSHVKYMHSLDERIECEVCGASICKYYLADHKKMHETPKHECKQCGKKFFFAQKLKVHVLKTHEKPTFNCEFCGKQYHLNKDLQKHINFVHKGKKDFPCEYCDRKYSMNSLRNRHIIQFHMKLKIKCEVEGCNKECVRKHTYKSHILKDHKDLSEETVKNMLKNISEFHHASISNHNVYKLND